ncbi:MAG: penicillin-binding protein 1A [Candidatus Sumerlaeaceae bacterium]
MKALHPVLRKWFVIFSIALMIGIMVAGLTLGAIIGYINSLPPINVLDHYNPPEISRVYDRTGNRQIGEFFTDRRELVRIDDIPDHVLKAFLAIEDERFYRHFGVDLKGVLRALRTNVQAGGKTQGASTITMQVARNVVLEDLTKNWKRKFKELFIALQIERNYSKNQILEFYLNHIFFGARAYGIQEASKAYFNKDVKDLTIEEGALLAGLPKAPSQLSPLANKEKSRERRNLVLFNMRKNNFVIKDDATLKQYQATPIEVNPAPRPKTEAPYFVDYVSALLMKDNSMQAANELGAKGYQIISTVDLNLQKICEEELSKGLRKVEVMIEEQKEARQAIESGELGGLRKGQARLVRITDVKEQSIIVNIGGQKVEVPLPDKLPYFEPEKVIRKGNLIDIYIANISTKGKIEAYLYDKTHVQGAAVLLDVHTGEIVALVGGDDRNDPVNNGQFNRAFQGGRQPGSCWKPLLYGGALDLMDPAGKPRFAPGSILVDEPYSVGEWSPKNYEPHYKGQLTLFMALVESRNIPTVKLFMDVGTKRAVDIYNSFNVVTRPSNWKLDPYPPMCLGTPNITPLELAASYMIFPNGGIGITPAPIKRLFSSKSSSDSRIYKPEQYRVISAESAYMMCRILQEVPIQGTAKASIGKWQQEQIAAGRKLPEIGGKTGTTNDCFVAWFCGFTPDLVLAIYAGYDQHRSLGAKMTGGKVVGPIWVSIMDRVLHTRNDWKLKFEVPPGVEFRDMCGRSGERLTGACYASEDMKFKNTPFRKGTAPNGSCDYHGGMSIASGEGQVEDPESRYEVGYGGSIGQPGPPLNPQQQPYANQQQSMYR